MKMGDVYPIIMIELSYRMWIGMNETRKKIIINEIQYWKKTRILPEQYCDYLIALYSEGESMEESVKIRERFPINPAYLGIASLVVLAVILSGVDNIPPFIQILACIIIVLLLAGIAFLFYKKSFSYQIPLVSSAFVFLLANVRISELFFPGNIGLLYLFLFIHCFIWFLIGKKLHLPYFTIASLLGTVLILYFIGKLFHFF